MTANDYEEISISGTLTYADYKQHSSYHRRKMVIGYFLFVSLFFIYTFFDIISGSWFLAYPFVIIFSFIPSGLLTLLMVSLMNLRIRNEYKSDKIIKNEISYVINNDGINQKVRRSNVNIEWSDILVAKEDKDMFRLYISKNKAILLPKRFFNSKEEITALKTLIKSNLNSKKVKNELIVNRME